MTSTATTKPHSIRNYRPRFDPRLAETTDPAETSHYHFRCLVDEARLVAADIMRIIETDERKTGERYTATSMADFDEDIAADITIEALAGLGWTCDDHETDWVVVPSAVRLVDRQLAKRAA